MSSTTAALRSAAPSDTSTMIVPTWRRVLLLAAPVLLQQALIMFVGLYDQYLAGNNQPDDPDQHVAYQNALTNANYLAWFISSFAALVTVGATAMVARAVGAKDRVLAVRITNQTLLLAVVFGIIGAVVSLLLLRDIVEWLQLKDGAAEVAIAFLTPILAMVVFQVIEQAGIACLVGAGDTISSLFVLGGVAILNIPLAWVFFHGWGPIPSLGFQGITIGTATSHAFGAVVVLLLLAGGRAGLQLNWSVVKPDFGLIRRLLRISIPACLDTLTIGLCQLWFLSLVNRLGGASPAAHGIAIRWESMGYLSGQAFATAAAALVGQQLGASNPKKAARCGYIAFGMGCAMMCLMGLIFFTFAEPMFRLFNPFPKQKAVNEAGVPLLELVAFAMPPLASIIIFTGALRGAGDTRIPMLITWLGFVGVRLPLAYWLMFERLNFGSWGEIRGVGMGLYGAWLAMFADLVVRGVLMAWRFTCGAWKRIQV